MSPYKYTALDRNGVCHRGYTFSQDIKGLIHALEKRHLFLVSYRKILHLEQWIALKRARKEVPTFLLHMQYMTHGGLGITPALQGFSGAPGFSAILNQIISHIQNGKLLSEAMTFYPPLFDPFVLATIRMGEKSNHMSQAFEICFSYLMHREKLKQQIQEAVRYPCFLLGLLACVTAFLFTTMVPALLDFVRYMGGDLPFSTRLLMHTAYIVEHYGFFLVTLCAGIGVLYFVLPAFRKKIHPYKYKLPYLGQVLLMLDLSAFFQQLSMLQKGGVGLLESISIAAKTNRNLYWKSQMDDIINLIKNGARLSEAFSAQALIPTFVIQLLETGEKSGSFSLATQHLNDILNRKTSHKIQQVISILNPLFMLLVGGLLLWLVTAIFPPLYSMVM